jgi:uncharacterized protein (TIGR02594 family)
MNKNMFLILIGIVIILFIVYIIFFRKKIKEETDINEKVINNAKNELGVKEIPGPDDEPQILKYFEELGLSIAGGDEESWCAVFVNYILKKSGANYIKTSGARKLLELPNQVVLPKKGDVVIFWRETPTSWKGHTGFYVSETASTIKILGGNQNNSVSYRDMQKYRLLGYRRPLKK